MAVIKIGAVHLFAEHQNPAAAHAFPDTALREIVKQIVALDCRRDPVRHFSGNLRAVLPVHLVSIILLRIVACRHVDTGYGSDLANRKGQLGCRTKRREQIDTDSIPGQNLRRELRKLSGMVPAVIGYNNASVRIFSA